MLPEQRTGSHVALADADEAALDAHEDAQVVGSFELRRGRPRVDRTGRAGLEAPARRAGGPELGHRELRVGRVRK